MVRSNLSQQSVVPLKKGSWSPEEDHKLIAYIQRYGIWNWSQMPKPAGLARSGKSCRLRWVNYLRPDIKRGNFTKDEEEAILRLHLKMGNRWSAIAAALPGRTDNEIKNYWHTNLKKRFKAVQEAKVLSSEKANINKDLSETELFLVDDEALNIMASKLEAAASREMSPPSPQLSRDNLYSSSSGRSTVHDHGNQIAEQQSSINCASDQTFGELQSLWAQSNYSQMVEDHSQSIFTDPIFPCESYNDASNDYWVNFYINTSVDI